MQRPKPFSSEKKLLAFRAGQVNIIGLAQPQLRYLFSPSLPASSRNHLPPSESRHGVFATTSLLAVPVPNVALERKAAEGDE